eukprot:720355-Prorocentrum_minimum.AAC.1
MPFITPSMMLSIISGSVGISGSGSPRSKSTSPPRTSRQERREVRGGRVGSGAACDAGPRS